MNNSQLIYGRIRSGDIALHIFNEYLEIHNIGRLYDRLTIDQPSSKHPSRRHNEKIAQAFYARKYIERFGCGTRRIFRLCNEQHLPKINFFEDPNGFQVQFTFKVPLDPLKSTCPHLTDMLSDIQKEVIQILSQHGYLSTKALRKQMKEPPSECWLRNHLNQFVY